MKVAVVMNSKAGVLVGGSPDQTASYHVQPDSAPTAVMMPSTTVNCRVFFCV